MSLASDYSEPSESSNPRASPTPRPPRWSKMRSSEGSVVESTAASQNDLQSTRKPMFSKPQSARSARSQSEASLVSLQSSSNSPSVNMVIRASQQAADAVSYAEVKRIVMAAGHSAQDKHATLREALNEISHDPFGAIRKADVRRWFQELHVPVRMADKVYDYMMTGRRGSHMDKNHFKNSMHAFLGGHLYGEDSHDGSNASHHHHHHHNIHGLLRPRHSIDSHCSVVNADDIPVAMTKKKLARIAKQMGSNHQSRYIDKYGNINRMEIQHLFESYGLPPEQGNDLFDSIDTQREGEIKFKDLHDRISNFLHVEEWNPKTPKKDAGKGPRAGALDEATMVRVCDHLGHKCAAKHKTVQAAFRYVDRDFDQNVDRFEVRNFFRQYGCKTKLADAFFDKMDVAREGTIHIDDFKNMFAPYIQAGYHPPVAGEIQKRHGSVAWGDSHYDHKDGPGDCICQHVATHQKPKFKPADYGRRSNASSHSSGAPKPIPKGAKVKADDELHMQRFGRFQGVSTYTASYNPDMFVTERRGSRGR